MFLNHVSQGLLDFRIHIFKIVFMNGICWTHRLNPARQFLNSKGNLSSGLGHLKKSIFNIHDLKGIKLLTQLRVEFSDLRNHRYRHNFHCLSPSCLCKTGNEDNEHFLLHCPRFSSQRRVLLDQVSKSVDIDIMRLSSRELCNLLLYGHSDNNIVTNRIIIESTLNYIKTTKRFDKTR